MAKFRIRLKVQGLELEIDGERQDIPAITATVQRQLTGLFEPAEVIIDTEKKLKSETDQPESGASAGKGRSSRRRASQKSTAEAAAPIEFRHESTKYGNPLQSWSIIDKCIWLLYVLKNLTPFKEVEAAQLVATFNEDFKVAGRLHPPHVPRELARARGQNPAPVGEDKGRWFLTAEGDRQAQELVKSLSGSLIA